MSAPYLIGLTGGIGSGKSTAAKELERLGAQIVSGDELGRQALEKSTQLLAQIRERFGDDVFDRNGKLLRQRLGETAFADAENARWLTHLTFPAIHKLWRDAVNGSGKDVVVFDAAMIFEWGIEKEFDLLLIVQAGKENVVSRMVAGGRLSREEIEARLAAQIPANIKAQKADVVLVNDGTLDEFREKIHEFWTARVLPQVQHRRVRENGSSC